MDMSTSPVDDLASDSREDAGMKTFKYVPPRIDPDLYQVDVPEFDAEYKGK